MRPAIPEIDSEKCTACAECVEQCPTGAVEIVDGRAVVVRLEDCSYCTDCEGICPAGAIRCPFEIVLADPAADGPVPPRRRTAS